MLTYNTSHTTRHKQRHIELFAEFCFDDGIDIPYSDINELSNIPSAIVCQQECNKNPDCNFFAFNLDVKHCWLKNGITKRITHAATISGPRQCSSGIIKLIP